MVSFNHNGIDLFFNNVSDTQAKVLVQLLNRLQRTMHGQKLVFKLNRKHPRSLAHQANSTVITTRYKSVKGTADFILLGLEANRRVGEAVAGVIGFPAEYDGSEFYLQNCDMDALNTEISNLVEEFNSSN